MILDVIVLFGGVQALSLCFYLLYRKAENKQAHRFFLLFLFGIALYNLGYAALFMNLQIGFFNMGMLPIPYKYIIAPALFGYVVYSLSSRPISKLVWTLMIPAILYSLLRSYWLVMIGSGKNTMVIKEAYDAGFFTANEIVVLLFNLTIGLLLLRKIRLRKSSSTISFGTKKYWTWLSILPASFILLSTLHLLLIIASYVAVGVHDRLFYYPTLIINSLYVYWLGFVGYSRSNLLFFKPLTKQKSLNSGNTAIEELLDKAMNGEKLFKNPRLTSQQLATELGLSMNELTRYINARYEVNFSQYLNSYRTQEAIHLMTSDYLVRYSLEALAKEAGFNSKSSFYQVFKDQTGKTPSVYLKSLNK